MYKLRSRLWFVVFCVGCNDISQWTPLTYRITWWRHQMETFSALLAICAGNHRSMVNTPHKGQWHEALVFSLIFTWTYGWVNNREASDLIHHRAHYDVIVMGKIDWCHKTIKHNQAIFMCAVLRVYFMKHSSSLYPGVCLQWTYNALYKPLVMNLTCPGCIRFQVRPHTELNNANPGSWYAVEEDNDAYQMISFDSLFCVIWNPYVFRPPGSVVGDDVFRHWQLFGDSLYLGSYAFFYKSNGM